MDEYVIKPIAYIKNALNTKFGVPRQSGIVKELISEIVFTPEYRVKDALRGLEGFSHIWLIWGFSEARGKPWSPTVRPPRLGGNERLGVFATRSPYRPNSLALSCVEIVGIKEDARVGSVISVSGADLMNGTPIYDIKPYIPYADCIADAKCGFAPDRGKSLEVEDDKGFFSALTEAERSVISEILSRDPRPQYHSDENRIYGLSYGKFDVKFRVCGEKIIVVGIDGCGEKPIS